MSWVHEFLIAQVMLKNVVQQPGDRTEGEGKGSKMYVQLKKLRFNHNRPVEFTPDGIHNIDIQKTFASLASFKGSSPPIRPYSTATRSQRPNGMRGHGHMIRESGS